MWMMMRPSVVLCAHALVVVYLPVWCLHSIVGEVFGGDKVLEVRTYVLWEDVWCMLVLYSVGCCVIYHSHLTHHSANVLSGPAMQHWCCFHVEFALHVWCQPSPKPATHAANYARIASLLHDCVYSIAGYIGNNTRKTISCCPGTPPMHPASRVKQESQCETQNMLVDAQHWMCWKLSVRAAQDCVLALVKQQHA